MSAEDIRKYLLFPDANRLLGFYTGDPLPLVEDLVALERSVLVTKQVRDEVERRKTSVATEFAQKVRGPQRGPSAPWIQGFAEFDQAFEQYDREYQQFAAKLQAWVNDVARSEDPASTALRSLMASAIDETDEQFARARRRRERGNPPGKGSDGLGDQISWEQILDLVGTRTRHVWIVTADRDYGRDGTLDAMMARELKERAPDAKVTLTTDLSAATNACLEALGEERRVSEAARREYAARQAEMAAQLAEASFKGLNALGAWGLMTMLSNPDSRQAALTMLEGPLHRRWLESLKQHGADDGSGQSLHDVLQQAIAASQPGADS